MIAIYLRVSTDMQSVDHQRQAIHKRIKDLGEDLTMAKEYTDEGISGSTVDRPAYQQLIMDINAGRITRIIAFERSRFSRTIKESMTFLWLCEERGVIVETYTGERISTEASMDFLKEAMHAAFAQEERLKISERTKSGLRRAREQGKKLGAPIGNKRSLGRRKKYDPDTVARILRLRSKNLTFVEIAELIDIPKSTIERMIRRAS